MISDGQTLSLYDYRGQKLNGCDATVSGDQLTWAGQRYSMSGLAADLLKKHGYTSDSVQGPKHWRTESGDSIFDLWTRHLRQVSNADG
jgi:hypothetical protein